MAALRICTWGIVLSEGYDSFGSVGLLDCPAGSGGSARYFRNRSGSESCLIPRIDARVPMFPRYLPCIPACAGGLFCAVLLTVCTTVLGAHSDLCFLDQIVMTRIFFGEMDPPTSALGP